MLAQWQIAIWRTVLSVVVLLLWELASDRLVPAFYVSRPSDIAVYLIEAFSSGAIFQHLAATLTEVVVGFSLGLPIGLVVGLLLGSFPLAARIFQPFVILFYSLPLLALAPLLIFWFGIGPTFKIVLVAVSVFFFIFFNTYSGARAIDGDLVASLRVMGATWREVFQKVTLPASIAWIFSGVRIAAPYALAAAIVGEMLVARAGLGQLLIRNIQMNDIAGLYGVLLTITVLGIIAAVGTDRLEQFMLARQGRDEGR